MAEPIKCKCAICGREMIDEQGGESVTLCSEECEDQYDNPEPWRPDPVYRAQYDHACGYVD